MKIKRLSILICAILIATTLILGLVGCQPQQKDNGKKNTTLKVNAKEVYAMSAISSASFLSRLDGNTVKLLSAAPSESEPAIAKPDSVTDADVQGIKNCLGLFDGIVNAGDFTQTTVKNTETEGEFKDYNFVMTIALDGVTPSVKMYFDELETTTQKEIEDEKEEVETSTTLQGVMLVNDVRYDISGKREVEQEEGELEVSIEFTTKSKTNPQNYITISQSVETENGEQEIQYEYKIYKDGKLLQETEIELEQENDETELEFKLKDLSNGQYTKTVYTLKKDAGEKDFVAEFIVGETKNVIGIQTTDSGYVFTYSNGYSEKITF